MLLRAGELSPHDCIYRVRGPRGPAPWAPGLQAPALAPVIYRHRPRGRPPPQAPAPH